MRGGDEPEPSIADSVRAGSEPQSEQDMTSGSEDAMRDGSESAVPVSAAALEVPGHDDPETAQVTSRQEMLIGSVLGMSRDEQAQFLRGFLLWTSDEVQEQMEDHAHAITARRIANRADANRRRREAALERARDLRVANGPVIVNAAPWMAACRRQAAARSFVAIIALSRAEQAGLDVHQTV